MHPREVCFIRIGIANLNDTSYQQAFWLCKKKNGSFAFQSDPSSTNESYALEMMCCTFF